MKFPMEQKRAYHGMGLIQNVIYLFGGFQKVSDEATLPTENYLKSTFAFDATKKVSKLVFL